MSLRRRLVLGFVVVAVVLAVADFFLISTVSSSLTGQIDQRLHSVPRTFGFASPGGPPGALTGTGDARRFSEVFVGAFDPTTGEVKVLAPGFQSQNGVPSVSADQVAAHLSGFGERSAPFTVGSAEGGSDWRVVVSREPSTGAILVVGLPLASTEATFTKLALVTVAATGIVLVALALVGWWVLRLGLRPIAELATTADEVAAGDLSRRITDAPPGTEAGRLSTAFNRMVDEIEVAFAERAASEDRLRQFVADASHELRTPLTSIRGYADLYRQGALDAGELDDAMRRITDESVRMGGLVDDLLLLARLDRHRQPSESDVDLGALAVDAVSDARAVEPDRPFGLVLPEVPVVVRGDEHQFRQVLANLLANCRVHTPPGTPVTVRIGREDGRARLEVADLGPGMAPEVAERVFDRFFRADPSRSRSHGGAGLGLSIVSAVAEGHGGRAWVESRPGAGTRVVVELPEQPLDVAGGDAPVAPTAPPVPPPVPPLPPAPG